jgi:hypothetical protein
VQPPPTPKREAADPARAIERYYADYEQRLRADERTRGAAFSFDVKVLEPEGAGWRAEVERRVELPGQGPAVRLDKLRITRSGSEFVVESTR